MDEARDRRPDDAPGARSRRTRAAILALAVALVGGVVAILFRHSEPREEERGESTTPSNARVDPTAPGPRRQRAAPEQAAPSGAGDAVAPASIAEGSTAVSVEVVTEDGRICREGTVAFEAPNDQVMKRAMAPLKYLGDASLAAGNPVVLRDLPDLMDGLDVEATALVPGQATATAQFTIRAHRAATARIVVPRGRSAEVRVVDAETDAPVARASVVSLTEAARRRAEASALRGTTGPGAAMTDADGRCIVTGLGSGEHELEIRATGYRRTTLKWSVGVVTARAERVQGKGTVFVTVIDPDGKPAPNIVVEEMNGDRNAKTGSDGRARFDDVAAGPAFFRFELPLGNDFDRWQEKMDAGLTLVADVEVTPGGSHEVQLGMPRPATSFEGRLVGEDGSPIPGVEIALFADLGIHRATTDEAGYVRLPAVPASKVSAFVKLDDRADWVFDDVEVKAGERGAATWTLGSASVRGRVVRADTGKPVSGAAIRVSGPLNGLTSTDGRGGFAFARARAGRYRIGVEAPSDPGYGARLVEVTVPSEREVLIELVRCGEVVVRYSSADRAALRDARIVLTSADGTSPTLQVAESGDGDLVARNVPPGRYEIVVELSGRRRTFPVEVKGDEKAVVEIGAP